MANKMTKGEQQTRDKAVKILVSLVAAASHEFDLKVAEPKWSQERGLAHAVVFDGGDYEITVRKLT